jgi:hypothetical protein
MIPTKVKKHLDEYIYQEIYVQIALIKGKEKGTTKSAINKYFSSNHFKELIEGKPYNHFIDELRDKCLSKLINSPMKSKDSNDEVIKELQKKLNELSKEELENTYWEIETGEYLDNKQVNELESERDKMIEKLDLKKKDEVYETIVNYCKKYEELCNTKYPEAPLPLEILKSLN